MDNPYIEYSFSLEPKEPATEILIAELGNVGFESFAKNKTGVLAYVRKKDWTESMLNDIFILNSEEFIISFTCREVEQVNWNEKWEKNFNPIQVDNIVSIRAPFHDNPNLEYDIVIKPKMSFGTGHHETTYMMIQYLIKLELANKKILDMGCGTGVLAIFAEMKGAHPIDAIDIDNWCYVNSLENIQNNGCKHITVSEGDATLLSGKKYDLIIANINRNILLNDMHVYANCLNDRGILLLSGFYKEDIPIIDKEISKFGMTFNTVKERNNWVALNYVK